ncbi:hypothetical protein RQCS_59170 (plasmid) [Rhodococcus qingshengii]|nr:hypothetical protein RQCS_59170 [Rhodococcus qingshengii]
MLQGDLIHIDTNRCGRTPDGGGHRKVGRRIGNRRNKNRTPVTRTSITPSTITADWRTRHILGDERKETASGFFERAKAYSASPWHHDCACVDRQWILLPFNAIRTHFGPDIQHKRTRPYRPQTNGKVERFNKTLNQEWAYANT